MKNIRFFKAVNFLSVILMLCITDSYGKNSGKGDNNGKTIELIERFIEIDRSQRVRIINRAPFIIGERPYTAFGEINYDYPIGPIADWNAKELREYYSSEGIVSTEVTKSRKESREIINLLRERKEQAMKYIKENYDSNSKDYARLTGELADISDIPFIMSKLDKASTTEKLNLLTALMRILDGRTISRLKKMLDDENEIVRMETCMILERYNVPEVYPALVKLLDSERQWIRKNSINILKRKIKEDYGYNPEDSSARRIEAVKRWKKWLKREGYNN